MKFNYKFSNLCGTVYKKGNCVFTPDGTTLISPVANRITLFDLASSETSTLPFEARHDIERIAISPNGSLLIAIDDQGKSVLINLLRRVVLSHFDFKSRVYAIEFSPNGKFFAVSHHRHIRVWRSPSIFKEFAPFVLQRTFTGLYDDVTCIDWSHDSNFFVAGSRDTTVRLFSLMYIKGFVAPTLSAHHDVIKAVFFSKDSNSIYSVSRDGSLFHWMFLENDQEEEEDSEDKNAADSGNLVVQPSDGEESDSDDSDDDNDDNDDDSDDDDDENESDSSTSASSSSSSSGSMSSSSSSSSHNNDYVAPTAAAKRRRLLRKSSRLIDGRISLAKKHYFKLGSVVTSVSYAKESSMMVVGTANGVFTLYTIPTGVSDIELVHSLSIAQNPITSVVFNNNANWLCAASGHLGQLVVWEWQSETFVLKQQGHEHAINSLDYAPDGALIITGGDDAKVKLWNTQTGFCFVTFTDHKAPVSQCVFSPKGHVAFSASLDGTVRAFDLVRYRNFRVMVPPTTSPAQFSCMAVDPSGDIVCAGAIDSYDIYVWAVQTGKITDVLCGHSGPVSQLQFNPFNATLASVSWDKTARVWDVFGRKPDREAVNHTCDVLAIAHRPDGRQFCISSLDGLLSFFEPESGDLLFTIDGRPDIAGGRLTTEARTAVNSTIGQCFTTIDYSPDGSVLLAAGKSKYICLYAVEQRLLLKKFQMSYNLQLDGIRDHLDTRLVDKTTGRQRVHVQTTNEIEAAGNVDGGERGGIGGGASDAAERLPGVKSGAFAGGRRARRAAVGVGCVRFAPTGEAFAAAAVDGLLIYSLETAQAFDPVALDVRVTPSAVRRALASHQYELALLVALRLNELDSLAAAFFGTPHDRIALLCGRLPAVYVARLLKFVAQCLAESQQTEQALQWLAQLLQAHGAYIAQRRVEFASVLRSLRKALGGSPLQDVAQLAATNRHALAFVAAAADITPVPAATDVDASASTTALVRSNTTTITPTAVDDNNDNEDDDDNEEDSDAWAVPSAQHMPTKQELDEQMRRAATHFGVTPSSTQSAPTSSKKRKASSSNNASKQTKSNKNNKNTKIAKKKRSPKSQRKIKK